MKPSYLHILLLMLLGMCAGCVNEYESGCPDLPSEADQTYEIRILFSSMANTTRALADEDILGGRKYENYINVSKTHFLLFTNSRNTNSVDDKYRYSAADGDETLIAELRPAEFTPQDNSLYPAKWEMRAIISTADGLPMTNDQMKAGYKIVCVANVDDWTAPAKGVKLGDWLKSVVYERGQFDYEGDPNTCIPMYGVLSINKDMTYKPMQINHVGQMHLMRAMTKIELLIDDKPSNSENLAFHSAYITNYYSSGRVAPDKVFCDTKLDTESECVLGMNWSNRLVFIPNGITPTTTDKLHFHIMADDKGKANRRAVLYVPEYDNKLQGDDEHVRVFVALKGMSEVAFEICKYDAGKPELDKNDNIQYLDLPRNYWLKFKLSTDGKYMYVVQAGMQQWDTVGGNHEIYNW